MKDEIDNNLEFGTVDAGMSEADALAALENIEDTEEEGLSSEGTTEDHQAKEGDQSKEQSEDDAQADEEASEQEEEASEETEGEEAKDEDGEKADKLFTVQVNGQEHQVSQEELVQGYQRQADYTRKSQDLAEERKTFDTERAQRVQHVEGVLQAVVQMAIGTPPDQALQQSNPDEYLRQVGIYQQNKQALDNAQKHIAMHKQELANRSYSERKQAEEANLREQQSEMLNYFGDRMNEANRKNTFAELVAYGETLGIPKDAVMQINQASHLAILDKARRWDALQSKKPDVEKRVREAPTSSKPGAKSGGNSQTAKLGQAMSNLRKTGSDEAAIAALNLLDDQGEK